MKSKVQIDVDLNNSKIIEKLLEFQNLDTEIKLVLRKYRFSCTNETDAVIYNKKLGLPIGSVVGKIMSLSKELL
jgi:hypothetical protein